MTYSEILTYVATQYRLLPEDIIEPDRSHPKAEARQVAMFLSYQSRPSLTKIAAAFHRDRRSVHHAVRVVSARMDTEKKFRARVAEIAGSLGVPV